MRGPRRFGLVIALLFGLQLTAYGGGTARSARPAPTPAQRAAATRAAAAAKFQRVARFERHLPAMREQVARDLRAPKPDHATAIAAIVRIMDTTYIRVGSERYARQATPSHGASSLLKSQVRVRGNTVSFDFVGKSHVHWQRTVRDPALARAIRVFLATPGDRLFETAGSPVTDRDVREFLHPFLPKDVRTLHANRLLAAELERLGTPSEAHLNLAIRNVAAELGHTPSVARSSYLDPLRIQRYRARIGPAR